MSRRLPISPLTALNVRERLFVSTLVRSFAPVRTRYEADREISIISASADRVWEILVDFARYPEWNPFVTSVEGEPAPGKRLRVRLRPPGGMGMTFKQRVLVASSGCELRWIGRLLVPGLFDGEHSFTIERVGARSCRMVQAEKFTGLLVSLFGRGFDATAVGFEQMNQALKARAERTTDAAP